MKDEGQDQNIATHFQHYTSDKLTPHFHTNFNEVTFSFGKDDKKIPNIKISKGEESCFIWSIFYALLYQVIDTLSMEISNRSTDRFNDLEYIFIDDPVSSLDENNLIELAVNIADLIKRSKSKKLKFIITTHNPLFYNVLFNEFSRERNTQRYILKKFEDNTFILDHEGVNDSPFAYHLFLKNEIEKIIEDSESIKKYHFNFLRNILEKTSTFLGYKHWEEILPKIEDNINPSKATSDSYSSRIINLSSHSKHSQDETVLVTENDKKILKKVIGHLNDIYHFNKFSENGK